MILIPVKLQCDECQATEECELSLEPQPCIPMPGPGVQPCSMAWNLDYHATNSGNRKGVALDASGHLEEMLSGPPTNAPLVTCSDDCRDVIDARKRLQGTGGDTQRESIRQPGVPWPVKGKI